MNILFNLIPKEKIVYLDEKMSVRQALEKMEKHRFSSIPVIAESGEYLGTISEGDILWFLKDQFSFDLKELEKVNIMTVSRHRDNRPVHIDTDMEDIISTSHFQNFVPVLDDRNLFIGIVTRKDIIKYLMRQA